MTRYNLSNIMNTAHFLRRKYDITMSQALRNSWAVAKGEKSLGQKSEIEMKFLAKYPTGTIQIHQFWRGATVQFTAKGKAYTYRSFGWQQKLGLTA